MNSNVLFGDKAIESIMIAGETIFFECPHNPLDLDFLWSEGDDEIDPELDNDCLSLYNEH